MAHITRGVNVMTDQVNSPKHYTKGFVETIYAIAEALGPVGFKAFCIGNAIKYYSREGHKNDANEDRAKGDQYLNGAGTALPLPINGFLPRIEKAEPTGANEAYDPRYEEKMARHAEASGQGPAAFDVYAQLAARMFDPNALGAQETARIPSKPEALGAGYGEQAKAKKTSPRAATVSASLNPAFVKALGYAPTTYFLRVEGAQCQ